MIYPVRKGRKRIWTGPPRRFNTENISSGKIVVMAKLTCRQMKAWLGCSRVIAWNSVVRRNEPDKVQLKEVSQQQEPEKGFVPTTRLQPIASVAHVDQDAVWGKELCRRAVGGLEGVRRVMIVNTWRPLHGEYPVVLD